jgi:DNA-binding transcriptional LysR family regulator
MKDDRLLEMRVFKAVVDAGGFTAAAHVLGVSQPFVSQTVTALERRLGVQLLHRSTRGRRLTDEGERFLALCGTVIDGIEQGESQIASSRSQPRGDLRVSAPLGFGMDQIVPRLPEFLARHPKIKLHLSLTDDSVNLIGKNVDVAVTMGRLQDSALVSRKLCNLQRVVVASPAYIARHGNPATPGDLAAHNCLMFEGAQERLNRWPFVIAGKREEVAVRGNFGSSNGITLFQLCTAGVGIMRCGEHLALPAIRAKLLVPLLAEYQAGDEDTAIHAIILPERQLLQRIRAFVDFLVEIFRRPPWLG